MSPARPTRRAFLAAAVPSGAALAAAGPAILAELASTPGDATAIARDESYWLHAQQAFTVDRTLINLNNGGVSPSPSVVQEAMKRYLDYSNSAPTYAMWRVLEPQLEGVRQRLARMFGADAEEIAITRNASEGLQICQLGIDLARGDEVLTTNQDYGRMRTTFRQREAREGIVLREFSIPVPAEDPGEIVRRFEAHITPQTRAILMCHVINLTGQVLPVKAVVRMARARGIPVIVDGAHSFGHLVFDHGDLDCDYFATSLHKYLFAPHGTGMLYVRRDRIEGLWPLQAAPDTLAADIRKFEEIGTHPAANHNAIAEAISFHEALVPERKEARMLHLRDLWAERLLQHDRVRLHTSLRRGLSSGLGTVEIEGIDPTELTEHLWRKHRIIVVGIQHEEFRGVRVSASVYTTRAEIDRFVDAMWQVAEHGLPA